ncbi:RluA family pseudouridine synthase [Helicobacter cappadocius]|uniref:Pseudouridine synthase n=1 Tax=Helicobacter cappadocius TaxID=3063998 RepID=A0AA90PLH3_9HELI|nr:MULTISPECIES: RluA family pseudouridine synthase [unclassified Helicobacter]MDO7253387.1 RluA family pseudouridine synthase [Helicobacter sp. faydin-H75]MDP2539349.1 RluA family pseudouridine synthase [Helicobacter sp. faydin-H76]
MKALFEVEYPIKRVDTFLSQRLDIPKNQITHLIKNSLVFINDKPCKKGGENLVLGDKVAIFDPILDLSEQKRSYIDIDISIIYEDSEVLVLNKPPFVVVHNAPSVKEPTLVDWLKSKGFSLSTLSGEQRFGIVHRLDKETSGAIVIAKTNNAHTKLSDQLQSREMGRYYLAIIDGRLGERKTIECQIGRNPNNRLKMISLDRIRQKNIPSRHSKSDFVPLLGGKNGDMELIGAKLYTGRTHQIRVHLESISRHIIGDKLYGYRGNDNIRVMLHAYLMYFIHPSTGKKMFFKAPVFDDMLEFLNQNFDKAGLDEVIAEDFILHRFNTCSPH